MQKSSFLSAKLPSGLLRDTVLPPAIMVLGTSSHAGKSLLTAGLCRLFTRRGLSVAPFKAQNMALNSAVAHDGGEMARAQALQAQACGLLPDVRMNPVLLKPESHTGSQVVVLGKARGHARVQEYEAMKPALFEEVCRAYAALAQGRDLMILEGAGSPAEINLRAGDMVNCRMAREARARAVLVGDIDRGGVFAALVGTLELMEPWERELIGGLIVNKFRGDASLLPPALDIVAGRTGKPFLGVMPWLADLGLPEEDSVSLRSGTLMPMGAQPPAPPDVLDVVMADLPLIGNIGELDPLLSEPGVRVRLVSRPQDLGNPDLIVLPGSKSTASDLRTIRESGLAGAVAELVSMPGGPEVLGICGGLQMLGLRIEDPLGLEEEAGHVEACLGLLPLVTRMEREKTLRRTPCRDLWLDAPLEGYEIHHGQTAPSALEQVAGPGLPALLPWMADIDGRVIGWRAEARPHTETEAGTAGTGRVWATYAHGLFDDDAYRNAWLNALRSRRGKSARPATRFSAEPGLDRLADEMERHLDMDKLTAGLL